MKPIKAINVVKNIAPEPHHQILARINSADVSQHTSLNREIVLSNQTTIEYLVLTIFGDDFFVAGSWWISFCFIFDLHQKMKFHLDFRCHAKLGSFIDPWHPSVSYGATSFRRFFAT